MIGLPEFTMGDMASIWRRWAPTVPAVIACCIVVPEATAGFTGWQIRSPYFGSGITVFDVFAGFSTPGDKLLNVFDMSIQVTGASFVQAANPIDNAWRPVDGLSNSDYVDSFITLGSRFGTDGRVYASSGTRADPSFSNYSQPNAVTFSAGAGWYGADPTSSDIVAVNMDAMPVWSGGSSGSSGALSVWCARLVVDRRWGTFNGTLTISGSASYNSGSTASNSRYFWSYQPSPSVLLTALISPLFARMRRRN
jgi:hypothetical protein